MNMIPDAIEPQVMSFHTSDGRAFVGLRVLADGRRQIVYDETAGKRVLISVTPQAGGDLDILAAMAEGSTARHALGGIIAALQARRIQIDYQE